MHGVYILVSFVPRSDDFKFKSVKVTYLVQFRASLFKSIRFSFVPGFTRVEQIQEQTNKSPRYKRKTIATT